MVSPHPHPQILRVSPILLIKSKNLSPDMPLPHQSNKGGHHNIILPLYILLLAYHHITTRKYILVTD